MSITTRYYLLNEEGTFKRFPIKLYWKLLNGEATIPEYANQTKKLGMAIVYLENRRPVGIERIYGRVVEFNSAGAFTSWTQEYLSHFMPSIINNQTSSDFEGINILDGRTRFEEKMESDEIERHIWIPSEEQSNEIRKLVFKPQRKRKRPRKVIPFPTKGSKPPSTNPSKPRV